MRIGIIGGSRGLGKFFLDFFKSKKIEVYFSSKNKPNHNVKLWTSSNRCLIERCNVIFLCVPIGNMQSVFDEIKNDLCEKTLIEVCSVKKFIVDEFKKIQKKQKIDFEFVSIHPMFGESTSSLKNKLFIENFENKKSQNYEKLKKIFQKEKAKFLKLSYLEHDKIMSYIQVYFHLNIFISSSLISKSNFEILNLKELASPNYRIFFILLNRYIHQNPKLYFEIQVYNSYGKQILKNFEREFFDFKKIILEKNERKFISKLNKTKKYFQSQNFEEEYKLSEKLINSL